MNIYPYIESQFYVVVKECDEICNFGRNELFYFIVLWQCLNVLEEKSWRRDSLSIDHNLLLEYENYTMKKIKLFFVIEYQSG